MKKISLILAILAIGIQAVLAQTREITGTVTSADDGSSIPGVSVSAKGTTLGTITDLDGRYAFKVPQNTETLVFTFVGMATQEVPIQGKTIINVELRSDIKDIDEVLVVAYGTSTKGSFTGSAGVVDAEELEKKQVSNVSNALAGTISGVQILSNNGQPGSSAKIRVRGIGSINAGSDPLYVVDGIPYDGDLSPSNTDIQSADVLSSLNPADIKTITVLKDAASTALYGARGANGIVMITTKSGSKGKSRINFDMKIGVNSRGVKNYDVLTSPKNYTELAYQSIYNAGIYNLGYNTDKANIYANAVLTTDEEGGYGYQIYTVPNGELLVGTNGKLNPNATLGYSDGTYYYTPDNWADETFQNNPRQEYNLSISGGDDKQTFYLSLGYLNDKGIISGSGFERFSGRLKGDKKVNDWLKVGATANYNNINADYPGEQTSTSSSGNAFFIANYIAPVYPVYVRDGTTHEIMKNNGRLAYDYGDGVSTNRSRSFMSIANPVGDLEYNKTEYLKDILNTNWFAEITPLTGLKLTAQYGLNLNNTRYNDLGNIYMGQSASYGGTAYQRYERIVGFDQQYVGNYQLAVNDIHQFDLTVGYDGYSYQKERLWANGQNLYNPESYYLDNVIDNITAGGYKDTYSTKGIFSRLNYSLKDTYFGNIAYRRDASSRFSPDNRWGDFWSASGAWILSNETFLNANWIDLLKVKGSFGQQGNDDIGNLYAWLDQFIMSGANSVFSDGTLSYKGNPDLTWETSTSYNIGVEFNLLKNKLNGTIEYFGRKSKDMLYNKPMPGSFGYTSIPMNIGSMTNSGFEIGLNSPILSRSKLTWSVNANATFLKNKINELAPELEGQLIDGSYIYEEGESRYRMYLVEYAGVDQATGEALYWTEDENGERVTTDDYSDASDYKIATDDLLPTVYGGFGTSVEAYGFDASIQCSYQLGGQIYDSGYRSLMHGGTSNYAGQNWHKDIYKAWTPENTNTNVPRLDASDRYANSSSTRWITSSNYLSINNISLGYTLPKVLTQKITIDKCRIYFSADNVALLTKRKGLDPRQSYTTATTARYTPIRTLSGGINLTF